MAQHDHSGGNPNHIDVHHHFYPPEFRQAVANWYQRRFEVTLDPESQVMSAIGGKEAIGEP